MKAGPMTEWLRLLKPVTKCDKFGAEKTEYVETARVHAERVKFTGRRSEEVMEHFPDYSVHFRIRDAHEIRENWRVKHDGGHTYNVVAIDPNRHCGMNTLVCERLNE